MDAFGTVSRANDKAFDHFAYSLSVPLHRPRLVVGASRFPTGKLLGLVRRGSCSPAAARERLALRSSLRIGCRPWAWCWFWPSCHETFPTYLPASKEPPTCRQFVGCRRTRASTRGGQRDVALSYRWRRNGAAIFNATSVSYTTSRSQATSTHGVLKEAYQPSIRAALPKACSVSWRIDAAWPNFKAQIPTVLPGLRDSLFTGSAVRRSSALPTGALSVVLPRRK